MAKPKASAVQPGEGHNSKELTEDERKSLFFHHLRKRMAHNDDIKLLNDTKKADGKTAQADGLVLGQIDYAIKAIYAAKADADELIKGADNGEDPFGDEDEFDAADPSKIAAE